MTFAEATGSHALISYSPTGTRLGLELLQASRIDACGIHWGSNEESHTRHPALLKQYPQFRQWVLIRLSQELIGRLRSCESKAMAIQFTGYDLGQAGELAWWKNR
jgi:hypothetical protein